MNLFRDSSLTFTARGILAMLHSYPDGHQVSADRLLDEGPATLEVEAINDAVEALMLRGYLRATTVRGEEDPPKVVLVWSRKPYAVPLTAIKAAEEGA